jgi:hypothetical protein
MISMVFDISSILYRVAAVQKAKNYDNLPAEDLVGLCMHVSLQSIKRWYEKYHPDKVIFAFDSANNWRKKYTAARSVTIPKQYKENRVVDPTMAHLYKLLGEFYETMKAHTSISCIKVETLEADDIIAGYAQKFASPDHTVLILSSDKDFIQLLKNPNVKLINPEDGKLRNQPGDKHYEENLDYWLFVKCVRGDAGDNVHSAFPKVRETKIKAAFDDEFARTNFMNEQWGDYSEEEAKILVENKLFNTVDEVLALKKYRVGDLFEQNKTLMSLFDQPAEIRSLLFSEIEKQLSTTSTYNHFHFLTFCGKYKLEKVADDAAKFLSLFSCNQTTLAAGPKQRPADFIQDIDKTIRATKSKALDTALDTASSKTSSLKDKLKSLQSGTNQKPSMFSY